MALDPHPPYPHAGCYVLKLHRDADPASGKLRGIIEHVATGDAMSFHSGAALQAVLLGHAATVKSRAATDDPHSGD